MLERRADSLAHLYNDADELSIAERRRVGEMLDRTVEQIEQLTARMASMDGEDASAATRMRLTPMTGSPSQTFMRRALPGVEGRDAARLARHRGRRARRAIRAWRTGS